MFFAGIALLMLGLVAAVMVAIGSHRDTDDESSEVEIPAQRVADTSERSVLR